MSPFIPLLLAATQAIAEPNLVPETPSTAPDYFCTWNAQGFVASYSNANLQADAMIEANLSGQGSNQNWLSFYPEVRGDLTFLLDDAFDFPLGGGHNDPHRGSIELDSGRFPSYKGTPAERLAQLCKDVKARGWRDLGLWICNSRPNVEELPIDSETYWCERLAWSQQAGVRNWKVDWGIGMPGKPLWKFKVTPKVRQVAPDVWIEFGTQGDLYRTYDVHISVSIPETIRRIAAFLTREDPNDHRLCNCEDEVYIGAALGCCYGVMRHPLTGPMPNGKPDPFFPEHFRNVKRRMDEVTRAVRWHRIAQPIYKGDKFLIDTNTFTDGKSKPAPARIARGGLPLPTVTVPDGKEAPYVLCSRHTDGEIAIATIGRVLDNKDVAIPRADVTLEVHTLNRPIGIFGEYASLTLIATNDLAGKRILAQDLAGTTPVDITAEVKVEKGKLVIPGSVIHRVGRMAAKPGDLSDPGLVLAIEGLTKFIPKPPMKPNRKFQRPDPAYAEVADEPGLPRVLLIGDSVSIGYTLAVRKELAEKVNVHRPPQNCGSSAVGLANIEKWLGNGHWDVIYFNHGLHDLSYEFSPGKNINEKGEYACPDNGGHHRVSPEEYRQNLTKIVALLRARVPRAELIFATTTPVSADLHHYVKDSELEYNRIAVEVMRQQGVQVHDLWAFAKPRIAEIQQPGNPHFTAKGSEVLAKEIARCIVEALK